MPHRPVVLTIPKRLRAYCLYRRRLLGEIARVAARTVTAARGMTQVAKEAGMSRESLYKALGAEGNPSFATVLKVARALGVKLHATAA